MPGRRSTGRVEARAGVLEVGAVTCELTPSPAIDQRLLHVATHGVPSPSAMAMVMRSWRLEPRLAVALSAANVRVALNGSLVGAGGWAAGNGDELAFLPPVSGG